MWNTGLDEAQAGIKIARRNINNLSYADDTTLMAESEEELKSLLKVKEESEIAGLKLKIQKTKIIAFLPRSKCLFISWLQSPSAVILEPPKIKSDSVSTVSPSISYEVMGPDAMIFVFWMLSFKSTFSLSSCTFIKRLFSSSISAISVVPSAYLKLLIFLPAILLLACASSSPEFLMTYSA